MLLQIQAVRIPASRTTRRSASKRLRPTNPLALGAAMVVACLLIGALMGFAREYNPHSKPKAKAAQSLYLEVQLPEHLKVSVLKPGDIIEGGLSQDVYSDDRKIFPAGSRIRLTVSGLERRRKENSAYWPWVIKVFIPAHENCPTFRSACVFLPNGAEIPLHVSLISISHSIPVRAPVHVKPPLQSTSGVMLHGQKQAKRKAGRRLTMLLQAESLTASEMAEAAAGETDSPPAPLSRPVTLAAGTKARVILLRSLSALKSRPGDPFRALLVEPVRLNSRVLLPEGTLFEGKVEKCTPPRWLSRPGSIRIVFTRLTLPTGAGASIMASLAEADLDKRARTRMDSEGNLKGGRPGIAWTLINLGVAGGVAKVSDDSLQLIIEAIVSTATDASTAGVTRIVAGAASGIFLITRRGRDVVLPKYTEMDVTFNRSLTVATPPPSSDCQSETPERREANSLGE